MASQLLLRILPNISRKIIQKMLKRNYFHAIFQNFEIEDISGSGFVQFVKFSLYTKLWAFEVY